MTSQWGRFNQSWRAKQNDAGTWCLAGKNAIPFHTQLSNFNYSFNCDPFAKSQKEFAKLNLPNKADEIDPLKSSKSVLGNKHFLSRTKYAY